MCEPTDTCGNGVLEANEGCDDGNTNPNDGCTSLCRLENNQPCNIDNAGLLDDASCDSGVCDTVGNNDGIGVCEAANICGNSVLDSGEGCDDGNDTGGDGCTNNCLLENNQACNTDNSGQVSDQSCASGVCDVLGNGGDGLCEAANTCGNGVLDSNEGCDDGNTNDTGTCNSTCRIVNGQSCNQDSQGLTNDASCASGLCDPNEGGDGICEPVGQCGNGALETDEGCDDGNIIGADGCTGTCFVENGTACNQNAAGLIGDASCETGHLCDTTGNGGAGLCEPENTCGNGRLDSNEGCDDGNTADGDGCVSFCLVEAGSACNDDHDGRTGDASCQPGTVCDDTGNAAPGLCEFANTCGNGTLDLTEGCDDGNLVNGDGCNESCRVEVTYPCNDEMGGLLSGASCETGVCDVLEHAAPGVCELANTCGNGVLEANEGCDDGNDTGGDGCTNNCLVENNQACNIDNNGLVSDQSCASGVCDILGNGGAGLCEAANTCGNGVLDSNEGCDDGNTNDTGTCNSTCRIVNGQSCNQSDQGLTDNASCASGLCDPNEGGDGICEPVNQCGNGALETGEGCDDGNIIGADGCTGTCFVENGAACNENAAGLIDDASCEAGHLCDKTENDGTGLCEPENVCGNGRLDSDEGCDDGNTAFGDGCNSSCVVEVGFACNNDDDGLIGDESCQPSTICDDVGNTAPGLCELENTCGNGVLDVNEGCDDGKLVNGDGCNASCKVEVTYACNDEQGGLQSDASCETGVCDVLEHAAPGVCELANTCGNGVLEANEGCDDGNTDDGDGCSSSCLLEVGQICNVDNVGETGNDSCASGFCNEVGNPAPGTCEYECGNGVLEPGEGCDDGNTDSGDGCDGVLCLVENGYECNASGSGEEGSDSCLVDSECVTATLSEGGTQDICVLTTCSDNTLDDGEGCDDGNHDDGDGCNASCFVEDDTACNTDPLGLTGHDSCASSVCDDIGNVDPGKCEPANTCGNGVLDSDEGCDDGTMITGNVLFDDCRADCKIIINKPCNTDPDGLTGGESCTTGYCNGDGNCVDNPNPRVDGHDDGVLCDLQSCDGEDDSCYEDHLSCELIDVCGDGVLHIGEECDDAADSVTCDADCSIAMCGDGYQNALAGEECDDAGESVTCNKDCTLARCGDGHVNAQTEECDEAGNGRGCDYDCTAAMCGDGLRNEVAGERCDDGNTMPGDGCNPRCQLETCGDGLLDRFEACDDNNTRNGDGCSADCRSETCLDGIVQDWEECEPDTTLFNDPYCDHDCTAPVCGDGILNTASGEQCDDGNTIDIDQCTMDCQLLDCPDPMWQPLEQCDGNEDASRELICTASCRTSGLCGNGVLDIDLGEQCDDFNTRDGDGCDERCQRESAHTRQ